MSTVEDRLIFILLEDGEPRGWWKTFEERTGISSKRWKNVISGYQRATSDMLAAASKCWPQYAFWLMTGLTDSAAGHIAPINCFAVEEQAYEGSAEAEELFASALAVSSVLAAATGEDQQESSERRELLGRIQVLGKWHAVGMAKAVKAIEDTPEYRRYLEARRRRLSSLGRLGRE